MKFESIGAFCNTFDLHLGIIGLINHFSVFLRVVVLHRFYCQAAILEIQQYWTNNLINKLFKMI